MRKKPFRDEYLDADFGDARLNKRLPTLATALALLPSASLPVALGDEAALEGGYRFLNNEEVEADKILEPHTRETVARCCERRTVVVAHDTTDFAFAGEARQGLGRLRGKKERGFFSHVALAIDPDRGREPLGVLHLENVVRGKRAKASARQRHREGEQVESGRWRRGVEGVVTQLGVGAAVHVMDREADSYEILSGLSEMGEHFVIRVKRDRKTDDGTCLSAKLDAVEHVVERDVPLSGRKTAPMPRSRRIYPARRSRVAALALKAVAVTLARPSRHPVPAPETITVNVVEVEELNPPANEPAVSWRLYTTEPIGSAKDIERVVDLYRCRWVIEEFFKALKTGCAIEKRQLESGHALMNMLAVFVPIAWRILRHRTLAHEDRDAPATSLLSDLQLRLLRRAGSRKLPPSPTVRDALFAIAAMGGHLKRNGEPGWITLWRGYERLLILEEGAALAMDL